MKDTYILGINMSNHDRSAALLKNGEIVCAISEERLDRRKHSEGFYASSSNGIILPPFASINYCLNSANISIDDLELVICGRSISECKYDVEKYIPISDKEKIIELPKPSHHLAHAYSSYFASGFDNALVIVIDEQGHWIDGNYEKVSVYSANNSSIKQVEKFYGDYYDISLGMFYDFFATILNFSDGMLPAAGKLMGLAGFGKKTEDEQLIDFNENGNFKVNLDKLIVYLQKKNLLSEDETIIYRDDVPNGYGTVLPELAKITKHVDWSTDLGKEIAYKAQEELENAVLYIVKSFMNKGEYKNICLAGGIFLNSIINNLILNLSEVDKLYIQPASTDDGTAIGYAYIGYIQILKNSDWKPMKTAYLGKEYSDINIESELLRLGIKYEKEEDVCERVAKEICNKKIVCWFQGKSEFGPRALGNRSILAIPWGESTKEFLNTKVKRRESFRPFAPAIKIEDVNKYFELQKSSPYMLLVTKVKSSQFPAITHVDGTARVQTVCKKDNEIFYKLLEAIEKLSGIPMVLNTSFNINGEPLVETPYDAIRSFFLCGADILTIGKYIIDKKDYNSNELWEIRRKFINNDNEDLFRNGILLYKKGLYEEALLYLELLCFSTKYNDLNKHQLLDLHLALASIYYENGEYSKADLYLSKIINSMNLEINLSEVLYFRSLVKKKLGDISNAKNLFDLSNKLKSPQDNNEQEELIYGILG